ncbi:uncharacterized protein LOC124934679 [Impatiens glandulifera]|uniref:uncharacterized protein LOC124934679 n=1 Tax=Impatiens glandulifera TaxID=253017 RepID=UPI001FB12CC1|nr:uncharacterized protein LOC124934679 [Impatiens glandulifera]
MGFYKAVATEMKSAIHTFLDWFDHEPVSCIVADVIMTSMMGFGGGNRPSTLPPVVSLWTSAASMFFAYYHFNLANTTYTSSSSSLVEKKKENGAIIDNIPILELVKSVQISFANLENNHVTKGTQAIVQTAITTHAKLISSYEELEPEFINALSLSSHSPLCNRPFHPILVPRTQT